MVLMLARAKLTTWNHILSESLNMTRRWYNNFQFIYYYFNKFIVHQPYYLCSVIDEQGVSRILIRIQIIQFLFIEVLIISSFSRTVDVGVYNIIHFMMMHTYIDWGFREKKSWVSQILLLYNSLSQTTCHIV